MLDEAYRENPLDLSVGYLVVEDRRQVDLSTLALRVIARVAAQTPADAGAEHPLRHYGDALAAFLLQQIPPEMPDGAVTNRAARRIQALFSRQEAILAWHLTLRRRDAVPELLLVFRDWMRFFEKKPIPSLLYAGITKGYFDFYFAVRGEEFARGAFAFADRLCAAQEIHQPPARGKIPHGDSAGFFGVFGADGRREVRLSETAEAVEALAQTLFLARRYGNKELTPVLESATRWGARALLQSQARHPDDLIFLNPATRPEVGAFRVAPDSGDVSLQATAQAVVSLATVLDAW